MRSTLLLLILIAYLPSNGQGIIPMLMKNGRYSFVKEGTSEVLIQRQFDDARPFKDGFGLVKLKGNWGVINSSGEFVLKTKYSSIEEVKEGYYRAYLSKAENDSQDQFYEHSLMVCFDKHFKELDFVLVTDFVEGHALVSRNDSMLVIDSNFEALSYHGNSPVNFNNDRPNEYNFKEPIKNGYFLIKDENDYNYMAPDSELLLEEGYMEASSFTDGLARVKRDGKYGYIDLTGDEVIPLKYDELGFFKDGLAYAKIGNGFGYINKKGEVVIPFQNEYQGLDFSEGLALVHYQESFKGSFFIDKTGTKKFNKIFEYHSLDELDKHSFNDGLALISDPKSNTYGYINKLGEIVVSPTFKQATKFKDGIAIVANEINRQNRYGIINKAGKIIVPIKYEKIYFTDCHTYGQIPYQVKQNRISTCIMDKDIESTDIENYGGSLFLVELLGQIFYVDKTGREYIEK